MNTVSDVISFCPVEQNILIPTYFGIPFESVSGFLKKIIRIKIRIKFIFMIINLNIQIVKQMCKLIQV